MTLPADWNCFQVLYSRYPPYTIDWDHGYDATGEYTVICGAVIQLLNSIIATIGETNCVQQRLTAGEVNFYEALREVDFVTGIVNELPQPQDLSVTALHWPLSDYPDSSLLGREYFTYSSKLNLIKLCDWVTWLTLLGSLVVLPGLEVKFLNLLTDSNQRIKQLMKSLKIGRAHV